LPKNQNNGFSSVQISGKSGKKTAMEEAQHQNQKRFTAEDTKNTEKERVRQRAETLVRRIGETCDELDKLAEENPGLVGRVARSAEEHKDAYLRLKARLTLADMAPRCQWVRQDGTSCGSPQMKQHIYCFAHMQMAEARTLMLMLPVAEDANAIQIGLMQIQKALIEDRISMKKAGLLLYSMQLALTNVGQTTFGQAKDEEIVRETVDEEEAFSRQRAAICQDENQKPSTTKDTKDTEGNQGLPLMNTDDTDRKLESGIKPVEWKPTPDMYRMDTKAGKEAYEESFGMKIGVSGNWDIGSSSHREIGTPPRAAVPHEDGLPQEHAETYAVLG
jgi:hypothetical protein